MLFEYNKHVLQGGKTEKEYERLKLPPNHAQHCCESPVVLEPCLITYWSRVYSALFLCIYSYKLIF